MVDTKPGVEYTSTDYIEFLPALSPPPATISSENSNITVIFISSNDEDEE